MLASIQRICDKLALYLVYAIFALAGIAGLWLIVNTAQEMNNLPMS